MSSNEPTAIQLWNMDPHTFNEWRANNDIPKLFAYLKKILPGFEEWLRTLPFALEVAYRVVPTGDLFKGIRLATVVETDEDSTHFAKIRCYSGDAATVARKLPETLLPRKIHGQFEPYFSWSKRTLKRARFHSPGGYRLQFADTMYFGAWRGSRSDPGGTRAQLFRDLLVLKLGDIDLRSEIALSGRNLDFTDLDDLKIYGAHHGQTLKVVNYSSCRNLTFFDAGAYFYTFYACTVDGIKFEKSKIQDVYIKECGFGEVFLEDCKVQRFGITGSQLRLDIRNCELRDVRYVPHREMPPNLASLNFRKLRWAFQAMGARREAADAYYMESNFERKSLYLPYNDNDRHFFGLIYNGSFAKAFELYKAGTLDKKGLRTALWRVLEARASVWRKPRQLLALCKFRLQWVGSLVQWLVWGYGEKPIRVLLMAAALIVGYATAFHYSHWPQAPGKDVPAGWIDDFYFSTVTFTTLGYGDFSPTSYPLKVACASEALLGAFTLGLFVAGFSNRTKY